MEQLSDKCKEIEQSRIGAEEIAKEKARRFIKLIAGEDCAVTFQTFAENGSRSKVLSRVLHGTLDTHYKELVKINQRGAGIFLMVNEGNLQGRSEENVVSVRAVFADLDGAPLQPLTDALQPHVVTETSPHRYQVFWRVCDMPLERFSDVQKAIARKFEADPQVHDLPRVMRIPSFYHMKKEPVISKLIECNDFPPYTTEEITAGLGIAESLESTGKGIAAGKESETVSQINQRPGFPDGERNTGLFRYACGLERKKLKENEIRALVMQKAASCDPPLTEEEASKIVDQAMKYRSAEPEVKIEVMSYSDLRTKKLEPLRWMIPKILREGVTILSGAPKSGKSRFVLEATLAVSTGKGFGSLLCERGTCLYLALEDNNRSFNERLEYMLNGEEFPSNAHVAMTWTRGESALDGIEEWIQKHPDCKLVAIDTLQMVRPPQTGQNMYEFDYESIARFRPLAATHGIAIVIVHHTRKSADTDFINKVSGTLGLTGAADAVMVLERKKGSEYGVVQVTGRSVAENKFAIYFPPSLSRLKIIDYEKFQLSEERKRIVELLEDIDEPLRPYDISLYLDNDACSTRKLLSRMVKDGQIVKVSRGSYAVKEKRSDEERADELQEKLALI